MRVILPKSEGAASLQVRGYSSWGLRANAVRQLIRSGHNYFIGFRDVQSAHALQFGRVLRDDGAPATLRMVDCYPQSYFGRRIQCAGCGKRHPIRVGIHGRCPGYVVKPGRDA